MTALKYVLRVVHLSFVLVAAASAAAWAQTEPEVRTYLQLYSHESRTWILIDGDARKIFDFLPNGIENCGSYGDGDYSCWITKEVEGLWCEKSVDYNQFKCRVDGHASALPISYTFRDARIKELISAISGGANRWATSDGRLVFECGDSTCRATPRYLDSVWLEKNYMPLSGGYISGEFTGEEAKRVHARLSVQPQGDHKKMGEQWNAHIETTLAAGEFAFSIAEGSSLENSTRPRISGTLEKEASRLLFDSLNSQANGRTLKFTDRTGTLEYFFDCAAREKCTVTGTWKAETGISISRP